VVITGLSFLAASPLEEALSGTHSAPPDPAPEITAFELPENTPTWGFEVLDIPLEKELPNIKSFVDRTSALALVAAKRALENAKLLDREQRPANIEIGCAYGTTLGCLESMGIFWNKVKTSNPKFAQPLPFTHGYANSPSSLLCIEFGLRGAAATFSGERLAGVEALMFAVDQIGSGSAEIILAGASDSLTPAAFNHLFATGQLSKTGKWDDGIIPGEGACMLVLESETSARARNAEIYAEVEGVNFFPIDPKSSVAPMQIATSPQETVVFVSTPCVHPGGGWQQPLLESKMPSFSSKRYCGDMHSVSPLVGAALGACVLSGKSTENLKKALQNPQHVETLKNVRFATATGYEPSGSLGVIMLKQR
jgi:hypothetical protein